MARAFDTFKIWLNDWFGSATVEEMTFAERGAYLELLMKQFQAAGRGLPTDDASLAVKARRPLSEWLEVKDRVLAEFEEVDGRLHNRKCSQQINFVLRARQGGKARGAAAERGAGGQFQSGAQLNDQGGAQLNDQVSISSSISSSSSERKKTNLDAPQPARGGGVARLEGIRKEDLEDLKSVRALYEQAVARGELVHSERRWHEFQVTCEHVKGAKDPGAALRARIKRGQLWGSKKAELAVERRKAARRGLRPIGEDIDRVVGR